MLEIRPFICGGDTRDAATVKILYCCVSFSTLFCFHFYILCIYFTTARKLLAGIRDVTNDAIVHASHFDRIEGAFTAIPLL